MCLQLKYYIKGKGNAGAAPSEPLCHATYFYDIVKASNCRVAANAQFFSLPAVCCCCSILCRGSTSATITRMSKASPPPTSRSRPHLRCYCCCIRISAKEQNIPYGKKAVWGHSSLCLFCRYPSPIPHRTIRRWRHLWLFRDVVGTVVKNLKQQQSHSPPQQQYIWVQRPAVVHMSPRDRR